MKDIFIDALFKGVDTWERVMKIVDGEVMDGLIEKLRIESVRDEDIVFEKMRFMDDMMTLKGEITDRDIFFVKLDIVEGETLFKVCLNFRGNVTKQGIVLKEDIAVKRQLEDDELETQFKVEFDGCGRDKNDVCTISGGTVIVDG